MYLTPFIPLSFKGEGEEYNRKRATALLDSQRGREGGEDG
jgi:hypothetical protein